MQITLRIVDRVNPETARRLIALAQTSKTDVNLDLNVSEQVAEGLLTQSLAPETVTTEEIPVIKNSWA